MINIQSDFSLKTHNTFRIDAKTDYFISFSTEEELLFFLNSSEIWKSQCDYLIIGAGSNILFTKDFHGIIFHSLLQFIEIEKEFDDFVFIRAGSGVVWDNFVEYVVQNNFQGIENLSLIPGTVGASAVQNIGAYGVEAKDFVENVEVIDLKTTKKLIFKNIDCNFAYRDSLFKKNQNFLVTNVTFKLRKSNFQFYLNYADLQSKLQNINNLTLIDIRKAIIEIRENKLPDYKKIGNAGSFFKNPVVEFEKYQEILYNYPNLIASKLAEGKMKLAAGWLIEQCGWKQQRTENVFVYPKQALVICNLGKASGKEIFDFSQKIIQSVYNQFGVSLEREVIII